MKIYSLAAGVYKLFTIFATFLIFSSCATKDISLAGSIADDALYFEAPEKPGDIPTSLLDITGAARIVILGETHYVQEHQEFLSFFLPAMYERGFRMFITEGMQCESALFDLYVQGAEIELPGYLKNLDLIILESLREFNRNLKEQGKSTFHMNCFDMNHWFGAFSDCLELYLSSLYGKSDLNSYVQAIKAGQKSESRYGSAITDLLDHLERTGAADDPANGELIRMCRNELESIELRDKWSDRIREDLIYRNIQETVTAAEGKIIINCGMWHAQKTNVWKIGGNEWMGMRLQKDFSPDDLYHLAVFAFKGEKKRSFNSSERIGFDIMSSPSGNNLTRLMAERSKGLYAFVNFKGVEYSDKIAIDYSDSLEREVPGDHFDGLLIYPQSTVLESSLYYE